MPKLLLAIRLEIESIYKNAYPQILAEPHHEELAMRLISGCITEIVDPKLYYSRFSFLESGKEAIDIKHRMFKMSNLKMPHVDQQTSPFLPKDKNKYYTRSTLVKNLFPIPSEGKVRAMFIEPPLSLTKLPNIVRRARTIGVKVEDLEGGTVSPMMSMRPDNNEGSRLSMPS